MRPIPRRRRRATPRAEYEAAHIPGAVFLDLDEIADTASDLPTCCRRPRSSPAGCRRSGSATAAASCSTTIRRYHTAARAWLMLTLFGAHDVAILDGGLAKWQAEGRAIASGKPRLRHRHFTVWADTQAGAHPRPDEGELRTQAEQVLDARSPARFTGEEPEPRPACAPAIPGSQQPAVCRAVQRRRHVEDGRRAAAPRSKPPGSTSTSRSSPPAGRASPPRSLAFGAHLLGNEACGL